MTSLTARIARVCSAAVLLTTVLAGPAAAQGFISPFIGTTVSKGTIADICSFSGCEDGDTTWGVALGSLGGFFGGEFDIGYTGQFVGEIGDESSKMLSLMGNVLIGPRIGPVQPYVLGGLGVVKLDVDFINSSLLNSDNTKFAWDIGGGLFVHFGRRVGIRGDIRHIRSVGDLEFLGVAAEGTGIDFTRASAALVLKF